MDNRPIGILDSGLGGLTVLKKVIQRLPNESTIFIGDQAHMPYGDRTVEDIIPMQIIGVIQSGALAASKITQTNQVAVIATNATVNSHSYVKEIAFRNSQIQVTELGEPKLAPLVEANPSDKIKKTVVAQCLAPLKHVQYDTLILGCTHYPLLIKEIAEFIGKDKKIVDPADQVAQYTFNVLKRDNLLAEKGGKHEYYTTGDPIKFMKIAKKWMHDPTLKAQHVE